MNLLETTWDIAWVPVQDQFNKPWQSNESMFAYFLRSTEKVLWCVAMTNISGHKIS